jgi:hypothetical protein
LSGLSGLSGLSEPPELSESSGLLRSLVKLHNCYQNVKITSVLSIVQYAISQTVQLLDSPIQFIDIMKLINLVRNLKLKQSQFNLIKYMIFNSEIKLLFEANRGDDANNINKPEICRICSRRIPIPRQLNAIINALI